MYPRLTRTRFTVASAACVAFLAPIDLGLSTADAAPPQQKETSIEDLVAYGTAHETNELFRYDFGSDTFATIGVVKDQYGRIVDEPTSLAYIPIGPETGLYCAGGDAPNGYLAKIDPLTAKATVYDQKIGWDKATGMVALWSANKWLLLAVSGNDLIVIDPRTGVGTYRCTLTNKYKALALDSSGLAYGVLGKDLWAIDLDARISGDTGAEWKVGTGSFGNVEAMEFAFGIGEARIDPSGLVGDTWVVKGLLLGFSENTALIVINPETGESVEYPCSFATLDFEGLVFLPENADGWGMLTVNACD